MHVVVSAHGLKNKVYYMNCVVRLFDSMLKE